MDLKQLAGSAPCDFFLKVTLRGTHIDISCRVCGMIIANWDTEVVTVPVEEVITKAIPKHLHHNG